MKRIKKVIFTLLAPLCFIGCQSKGGWAEGEGKLKVLSTTAQIGDLIQRIGQERISLKILIQGDLDPHSYEIVKGDAEKIEGADLIFYNGLGLEHGASISSILKKSPKAVAVGGRIQEEMPDRILTKDGVIDPHIWMDISLWQKGIDPITAELIKLDPEGKDLYRENAEELKLQMQLAHQKILDKLQKVPREKRYLVTSHDAFQYFTCAYLKEKDEKNWQQRFAAPEGLAPEGQLNSKDIQGIIDYLSEKKIHVIFPESNVSKDSIRKIMNAANELGMQITICSRPLYGDAMGGLSYLAMMEKNAETIEESLCNTQ